MARPLILQGYHLEVLEFIVRHVEHHGYQPSQGEVAEACGVDKTTISDRLAVLERFGLVVRSGVNMERAVGLPLVRYSCDRKALNEKLTQLGWSNKTRKEKGGGKKKR